jgi:hypothetical protein
MVVKADSSPVITEDRKRLVDKAIKEIDELLDCQQGHTREVKIPFYYSWMHDEIIRLYRSAGWIHVSIGKCDERWILYVSTRFSREKLHALGWAIPVSVILTGVLLLFFDS